MAEDKVYRCENCGGIMEFDVKTQTLKCPNCETSIQIENDNSSIVEHDLTLDSRRVVKATEKQSKTMQCSGCGASIEIGANDTAAKCPYCDSSYVLAERQEETIIPDGVVPFKIDKNQALLDFRNWMGKRWLAPNELKKLYQHGGFQSIYIPYWTFDAQADCHYTADGGKERQVKYKDENGEEKTKTEVDWYPTSGHVSKFFDDIQVPASSTHEKKFFDGIMPFNLGEVASYSPKYISGNLSENYSVSLEDGHKEAVSKMNSELRSMASSDVLKRYDRVRDVRISPRYSNETYKYLLLPVYSVAYNYKDKVYNVMINGQTGKVKGDYPYSKLKITILVIIAIIIIAGIAYFMSQN